MSIGLVEVVTEQEGRMFGYSTRLISRSWKKRSGKLVAAEVGEAAHDPGLLSNLANCSHHSASLMTSQIW